MPGNWGIGSDWAGAYPMLLADERCFKTLWACKMHFMINRLILIVAFIVASATFAVGAPILLDPAAPPSPALRYQLLPDFAEQTPGNAAPIYVVAFAILPRDAGAADRLGALLSVPLDQLQTKDVAPLLKDYQGAFEQLRLAEQRDHCRWNLPYREQGPRTQLPFVTSSRKLAVALAVRARWQISRRKYDDAIETLRSGFALARAVETDAMLMQCMVGAGDERMMLDVVAELQQSPGAPNLYWALANLPTPLINARPAFDIQRYWSMEPMPMLAGQRLEEMDPKILRDFYYRIRRQQEQSPDTSLEARLAKWMEMIAHYCAARQYLSSVGVQNDALDRMPVESLLAIDWIHEAQAWNDNVYKWLALPYWQSHVAIEKAEENLSASDSAQANPLMSFSPGVAAALKQVAQVERQRAMLQTIEAVRAYARLHSGKLPQSLDVLTETPAPLDPMTGKPFQYRANGMSATLAADEGDTKPIAAFHIQFR